MRQTLRTVVMLVVAASCSAVVGCSAEADEGETVDSSDDALSSSTLRARTDLSNVTHIGEAGASSIDYVPEAYAPNGAHEAPKFEAVSFDATPGKRVSITVGGDFPSNASVLVADSNFRVLASAKTKATDDGQATTVVANLTRPGQHFVLVRDALWVKPMTFDVSVRQIAR